MVAHQGREALGRLPKAEPAARQAQIMVSLNGFGYQRLLKMANLHCPSLKTQSMTTALVAKVIWNREPQFIEEMSPSHLVDSGNEACIAYHENKCDVPFVTYICYLSPGCAMAYLLVVTDMCCLSCTTHQLEMFSSWIMDYFAPFGDCSNKQAYSRDLEALKINQSSKGKILTYCSL